MAELLVYNKDHWMEAVPDAATRWPAKYAARYQKGDVIEVRPDGYFDAHGFRKDVFAVVRMPGVTNVDHYVRSERNTVTGDVVYKSKYRFKIENATVDGKGETTGTKSDVEDKVPSIG